MTFNFLPEWEIMHRARGGVVMEVRAHTWHTMAKTKTKGQATQSDYEISRIENWGKAKRQNNRKNLIDFGFIENVAFERNQTGGGIGRGGAGGEEFKPGIVQLII